jgi:hypothetical protein
MFTSPRFVVAMPTWTDELPARRLRMVDLVEASEVVFRGSRGGAQMTVADTAHSNGSIAIGITRRKMPETVKDIELGVRVTSK